MYAYLLEKGLKGSPIRGLEGVEGELEDLKVFFIEGSPIRGLEGVLEVEFWLQQV